MQNHYKIIVIIVLLRKLYLFSEFIFECVIHTQKLAFHILFLICEFDKTNFVDTSKYEIFLYLFNAHFFFWLQ